MRRAYSRACRPSFKSQGWGARRSTAWSQAAPSPRRSRSACARSPGAGPISIAGASHDAVRSVMRSGQEQPQLGRRLAFDAEMTWASKGPARRTGSMTPLKSPQPRSQSNPSMSSSACGRGGISPAMQAVSWPACAMPEPCSPAQWPRPRTSPNPSPGSSRRDAPARRSRPLP